VQRSVNVPLSDPAIRQLAELARREYRGPREQAAVLILEGLRRAGMSVEGAPGTASPARRQPAAR
jgi:hypothetical protein